MNALTHITMSATPTLFEELKTSGLTSQHTPIRVSNLSF